MNKKDLMTGLGALALSATWICYPHLTTRLVEWIERPPKYREINLPFGYTLQTGTSPEQMHKIHN